MPQQNEKLERFQQMVLEDAAMERRALQAELEQLRRIRLGEAEQAIRVRIGRDTQAKAAAITAEAGREISRQVMEHKRIVATRREEMGHEVFSAVREKIHAFTETEAYLSHLKRLYVEAFSALGNPYDGVIYLRREDMGFQRELAACLPGRHVTFREGDFALGGLIVDCPSRLLRADQSYDTALSDLDGHFAELFGIALADD